MSIVSVSVRCIRYKVQFTTHKTAVSRGITQKKIKYGACTPLLPGGPVHLLFVRVTDVFQMMVSHVCWTSTNALPWETAGRYTPSDGTNLHGMSLRATVRLSGGKWSSRGGGWQGGLQQWGKQGVCVSVGVRPPPKPPHLESRVRDCTYQDQFVKCFFCF